MVTFSSSGNSGVNNFGFGASGYESVGVKLTDGLTPDFTGTYGTTISLGIKADGSDAAGTGEYKGFVQTAGGSTTFTDATSFTFVEGEGDYTNTEFNLPADEEQFNVASKSMDWALLAWDLDQMLRKLVKYHPEEYDHKALDHIREEIHNIMEEKGLQFPG